jgi:integrase
MGVTMARRVRSANLENRTNRLQRPIAKKPVFVRIAPRVSLGYRRNQTAGTWVVRVADGKGGNWTKAIGNADDFADANDRDVLDYWQAQEHARKTARAGRGGEEGNDGPLTVESALKRYEADLVTRRGDIGNVARVRAHIPERLAKRPVALLTSRDLRDWRDGLLKQVAAASANRVATVLRAALNLAAEGDDGANTSLWKSGLKAIPDAGETRNVVLNDAEIRKLVTEARALDPKFGLLIEVAAVTGARVSQLARLKVRDLHGDRLSMPTSRKGKGKKKPATMVPIPASLVARLVAEIADRPEDAPLLLKPNGHPWKKSEQTRPFRKATQLAGLNPETVTMYALRHSSITRQLTAGVPIRVVASLHDTSVKMIEQAYSVGIDKHVAEMVRPALIDFASNARPVRTAKVVRIS